MPPGISERGIVVILSTISRLDSRMPVHLVGLDEQSDQRCVGRIGRERADGHRGVIASSTNICARSAGNDTIPTTPVAARNWRRTSGVDVSGPQP